MDTTSRDQRRDRDSQLGGKSPSTNSPEVPSRHSKKRSGNQRQRRSPEQPPASGSSGPAQRLQCCFGPALLATAFIALTIWSWRRWPDLLVDFGRELYLPWQLGTGRVLYRDLALLYGPLSKYMNAGLFELFGVSLSTLVAANLVVLAGISALLYVLLAKACDRLTATAAGLVFLGLFGFSQYIGIGNYNFVCPYSHEATHGVLFAVAMVFFLSRFALTPSRTTAVLAGLSFGLTLLTRSEVALAAAAAGTIGLGLAILCQDPEERRPVESILTFAAGASTPSAAAFLLFLTSLPVSDAATAVAGAWMPLLRSGVVQNAFYQEGLGFDAPVANLMAMLLALAVLLAVVALLVGADFVLSRWRADGHGTTAIVAILTLIVTRSLPAVFRWQELGRVLTVTSLVATVAIVWYAIRRRGSGDVRSFVGLAGFSVLALVLLGKMVLNPRIYHYGFYLAMPATLVLVGGLLWAIPSALRARWGGGLIFRAGAGALVLAAVAFHLERSNEIYRVKDFVVGQGGDAILDYRPRIEPRAEAVRQALQRIEALVPPDGTLVALPEGVMLNYLARRANPTPYTTFVPIELAVFGEPAILASLKATPPDYVLLVHKDTREYGVGFFGADSRYGAQIMEWVRSQYLPIEVIQHEPLVSQRFGIKIMKRRP